MSHTFFCNYSKCPTPLGANKKCSRCQNTRYCSDACHIADWPEHKETCRETARDFLKQQLYAHVVARHGLDLNHYPYVHFEGFMKHLSEQYEKRTLQEWMDDWLGGWYTENRERKELLRSLFQKNNMKWSQDAYDVYDAWALCRPGNRYEKMTEFIRMSREMF